MKLFGKIFFYSSLLALMVACGKDNKSGQSSTSYPYTNPYCTTPYGCNQTYYPNVGAYSSPYAILNTAQAENPCMSGMYYASQRIPIQSQITLNSVVTANDMFVGVTSYGDVAAIIGNGTRTATLVAYVCPRSNMSGQGSISTPVLGVATYCQSKPITAMNMYFPDGYVAKFRDPGYGVINPMTGQKVRNFSFCAY